MSWKPEVEELQQRLAWAQEHGGEANVEKQHAQGRLSIRERIGSLADEGSFREVGRLTGTASYASNGEVEHVRPAPYVMGTMRINGRPVAIGGEDFTVRGGTSWSNFRRKGGQGGFVEDLAHEYRIPLVNLIDGAGGTATSAQRRGYTTFPGVDGFERSVELLGEVPVVCAVLGTAAGGPAGRAILSHWSVMVEGSSQIFAAGPPVVERSLGEKLDKEQLGGSKIAVDKAGTVDNAVKSEVECFSQIRRFLSYLPQNVWQMAPRARSDDAPERADEALLEIVPRRRTQPYDMRQLVKHLVDDSELFEIQPRYGRSLITALGRVGGYPLGIVANNPRFLAGAMDSASARKQCRFMQLCDMFNIPLVFLVDVPGFMVGRSAEEAGTLRDGMRAVFVAGQLKVPTMTIVIRKCYGIAGLAACNKNGTDWKLGWPSAEWGSLPIEGGVAAAYRRELAQAPDPKAREAELEAELRALASPFRTAEAFAVEDIIDPRQTRSYMHQFVTLAQTKLETLLGPKHYWGGMP